MITQREMGFLCDLFVLALFIASVSIHSAVGLSVKAVGSETDVGGNATFQCDIAINAQETAFSLRFMRGTEVYVLVILTPPQSVTVDPSVIDARYSYDLGSSTMTITNVKCADDTQMTCIVTGVVSGAQVDREDTASIVVKVPPKMPKALTTIPIDLTSGIATGSTLSATCNANTGRDGKGIIKWKIYRGNEVEDASPNNVVQTEVSREPGDLQCTKRYQSTLTLSSVSKTDQDLVLTCFVENVDFQPNIPAICGNPNDDLCQQTANIKILYAVTNIKATLRPAKIYEGDSFALDCTADGFPAPSYVWYKREEDGNTTHVFAGGVYQVGSAEIGAHGGRYFCNATNMLNNVNITISADADEVVVEIRPTTPEPTEPPTGTPTTTSSEKPGASKNNGGDDDNTTIIVVVVVVVVVAVIIAGVAFYFWRSRRSKNLIEEPPEKPTYNNRQNLAFQNSQPDLVATDSKKPPSLNSSFDMNPEEALRYANLTYDNRPRSRKPMAIGDTSSEYSDIQMPQV